MALVHRTLTLLPVIGFAFLPSATLAAKLKILDGSEAQTSSVDLSSARFEPGTRRLVVSTVAGNIDCGAESALSTGQMGLVINDGTPKTYALRTELLPAGRAPIEFLPGSQDFQVVLPSTVGTECKSNNQTAFSLQFDSGRLLSIAENVYFRVADKTFDIRINEPVLCFSYATAGADLKISLISPAEPLAELLPGFSAVDYRLGGKVLNARSSGGTQCLDFTVTGNPQATTTSGGDRVFGARFEENDVESDVVVVAKAISGSDPIALVAGNNNQTFDYEIEVENHGNGAAAGVRVRELLPPGVQVNGATSWECTRYASASAGSGTACGSATENRLDADAGTIASGEVLVYTLHRKVIGGSVGDNYRLGAAAFVHPNGGSGFRPDRDFSNNSDPLTVTLVGNQGPTISPPVVLAYEDGGTTNGANPQPADQVGGEIAIPLSFTDNDSSTLTVTAITTNGAAGLPTTISTFPVLTGPAPTFTGVLTLPATGKDLNGSVLVTVTVSDGSSSTSYPINFDVSARNDAPVFTLSTNAIAVPTCTGTCSESLVSGFLSGVAAGLPTALAHDEGGQSALPILDAFDRIACVSPPSGFFVGNLNPRLTSAGNLVFQAGGVSGNVTCSITVDDNGSPQGTTTKDFSISYTSPPPSISGAPTAAVMVNEDNGAPVPADVIFTITDANGIAGTPTISSDTPSILNASMVATGSPNEWRVVFAPVADQNGSNIQLTVSATDTQGASATASFTANVAPVNDAPSFTLSSTALTIPACSPGPTCDYVVTGFVTALSAGPADESGQIMAFDLSATNRVTCTPANGIFGTASGPQILVDGASYRLVAEGVGATSGVATCELTLREADDTASFTTQVFTVTYP